MNRSPVFASLTLAALLAAFGTLTACSGEAKKDPAPNPAANQSTPQTPAPVDATPPQNQPPQAPMADTSSDDPKDYPRFKMQVMKPGEGKELVKGKQAKVHYTGTLLNGKQFDSSWQRGTEPAVFNLDGVVKGFRLGLLGMKVGERRRLTIPGELGYGPGGQAGAGIGPNETLVFDVELVDVID